MHPLSADLWELGKSNMTQQAAPFVSGGRISESASASMETHLNRLQQTVLAAINESGDFGMTDEERQERLGMNPSTERPRRRELYQKLLIEDSGYTRATKSGRQAVVWRLKATEETQTRMPL